MNPIAGLPSLPVGHLLSSRPGVGRLAPDGRPTSEPSRCPSPKGSSTTPTPAFARWAWA